MWLEREGREVGHEVKGEPDHEGLAGHVRTLGDMGAIGEL